MNTMAFKLKRKFSILSLTCGFWSRWIRHLKEFWHLSDTRWPRGREGSLRVSEGSWCRRYCIDSRRRRNPSAQCFLNQTRQRCKLSLHLFHSNTVKGRPANTVCVENLLLLKVLKLSIGSRVCIFQHLENSQQFVVGLSLKWAAVLF